MFGWLKYPINAKKSEDGGHTPSPLTLLLGTSKKTDYKPQKYEEKYTGNKPILVICTDESLMEMENKKKFSTGNHPVETFVPMLHFRDAGFAFDIATTSGNAVKLEMWAFPTKDKNVQNLHEQVKSSFDKPKKISDISSMEDYSALFIPGGHGSMINLPYNPALGKLLRMAHEKGLPTVTLCHGPSALLSTSVEGSENDFLYKDYKIMCFTDKTDAMTPSIGYLPGNMPWKVQETLEKKGMTILNKSETGAVHQDRELITGDSPTAANNLGTVAAPILVKYANENKL